MISQNKTRFEIKPLKQLTTSIRFRLTGWYVLLLAVVLSLFGGVIYFLLASDLHSGLDGLLRSRSAQLIAGYNIADGQINLLEQDESGPVLPTEGEVWLLLDPTGKLIQRQGKLSDADEANLTQLALSNQIGPAKELYQNYKLSSKIVSPSSTLTIAAGQTNQNSNPFDYRLYFTPVTENGRSIGTLILGRNRESVEQTLHRLLLVLLLVAPGTLLLSATGGYWLATRAMRPVRIITRAANEIGQSDLSRRLNFTGPDDEIGGLAATFDRMLERLEEAFNRQKQFTADASHELRTPLTIVNLEVSRVLARPRSSDEYIKTLETIAAENTYMTRLVENLLILARADNVAGTFTKEKLDLSDLTLEGIERLTSLASQAGVTIRTNELPELFILGNRVYLNQMISNLLENALKYTSGGDGLVEISTGLDAQGWAYLRVKDNGPGISADHLPYIFDRFYQADKARSHSSVAALDTSKQSSTVGEIRLTGEGEGSGLGLSIVKWVAHSHGGAVKVASEVGVGSVFEVRFPLYTPVHESQE